MIHVGIDPGTNSVVSLIDSENNVRFFETDGTNGIDVNEYLVIINELLELGDLYITIEKIQPMPRFKKKNKAGIEKEVGSGNIAIAKLNYSFGLWHGVFAASLPNGRIRLAPPQVWKRHFGLIKTTKRQSVELARELYPQAATWLKRVKDHNRAEALLIARYGQDILLGLQNND